MRSFIGGFLIVAIILLASMSYEVMDKHEKLGEARGYRNGWNECEEQYAVDHGPDNWTPPPDSITVREAIAMARVEASAELDTCICLETASIMLLAAEVGRRGIKRWGCWDNRGVKTWWYPPTTGGTPTRSPSSAAWQLRCRPSPASSCWPVFQAWGCRL